MALDFPNSPTHGQTYGNYTYDSYVGIWRSSSAGNGVVNTTTSAPTTATPGDLWFNPNDGTMYVYYNDGTSSQWVESRAPIAADGYQSPNYIINGDFEINQRGVSSETLTGGGNWTADRWFGQSFGTITVVQSRSTAIPAGSGFSSSTKFACTSVASGTGYAINYTTRLEGSDVFKLGVARGVTSTLSFWVRSTRTGTYGITINSGYRGSAYNFSYYIATYTINVANTWEYKTITITPNTSSYTNWYTDIQNGLELTFNITGGSGIATASTTNSWLQVNSTGYFYGATTTQSAWGSSTADEFYITGVQLESGTVATSYRRNGGSYYGELAVCQRYYERGSYYGTGWGLNSTQVRSAFNWKVPKRTSPIVTLLSGGINYGPGGALALNSFQDYSGGSFGALMTFNTNGGQTTNYPSVVYPELAVNAEL